jgi:hypothetical protein
MRRLALLAMLALVLVAIPAVAAASPSSNGDGGVPAGFGGSDSGGTPAGWDSGSSDAADLADDVTSGADDVPAAGDTVTTGSESLTATRRGTALTTASGGALAASAGGPTAVAAQEPAPDQPGDAGAPQPPAEIPTLPAAEAAAAQAQAGESGGTLPFTGIEVLQLTLLGVALLLVGARLRVLALRRRRGPAWRQADRAYDEDFAAPITARRATVPRAPRRAERDEWSFPDPDEPAPTGLLPSTASARRRARALAASDERR